MDSTAVNYDSTANIPCEGCCQHKLSEPVNPDSQIVAQNLPKQVDEVFLPNLPKTTYQVPFGAVKSKLPEIKSINTDWSYLLYRVKERLSLILMLILTLGYLVWSVYQRSKKNFVAAKSRGEAPPFSLPIKISRDHAIVFEDDLYLAMNRMRSRQDSDQAVIDIPRTIEATISNGGLLEFQFDQRTKSIEYLILIDKNNEQNHRAQLFESIFQFFRKNQVFVERFFFDADPSFCWNESHQDGISTHRLVNLYPDARLLVFSNGFSFINPITGKVNLHLEQLFESWQSKFLLTPNPASSWNYREVILSEQFSVFPSNLPGLGKWQTPSLR